MGIEQINSKTNHAFLGLSPTRGLIPAYRNLFHKKAYPKNLKAQPWFKLHLTLAFWPAINSDQLQELSRKFSRFRSREQETIRSDIKGFHFFLRPQVLYLRETSDEILNFQKKAMEFLLTLPKTLHPRIREERFTPHWTIARKFHTAMLDENKEFFKTLDSFELIGEIPAVSLYFSYSGRYECIPLSMP